MADRTGQRLGNYRLVRLLGRGGFAEVYLGEHTRLGTQAAIKVLYTQIEGSEAEYFLQEARTVAHLIHPHIVRIFDFDVQDGVPFLVMDYAPNGTLRQRHHKGSRLPLETIVFYIKQVADALQHAHDEKLIHRDIKPENMLVGRRNEILLSDFGIALIAQSTRMQSTQEVVGTAYYMAPEQLQGKPRIASDQYALGVVVYEWLTGDRPFHGSFSEIASQHMFVPPPSMREKLPSISSSVEEVVMTALAKDPHQRFGSVQAFARALEQASETIHVLPDTVLANPPATPYALSGTALSDPVVTPPSQPVVAPPSNGATSEPIVANALPPVIRTSDPINTPTQQNRLEGQFVLPPTEIVAPVPNAPPERSEPINTDPVTDSPSTRPQELPSTQVVSPQPAGPVVSRRAVLIGVATIAGLAVVGGGISLIVLSQKPAVGTILYTYHGHTYTVNAVAWSPDGGRIASGSDDSTVQVWNATDGSNPFTYKGHTGSVYSVAWSPDGQRIASSSYDSTVQVWNATDGSNVFTYKGHTGYVYSVVWSPDGQRIASGSTDTTVQVWNASDGSNAFTYKGHAEPVRSVAWSPDGKRIASGSDDTTVQVWSAADGSNAFTYNRHTAVVNAVAWSPDGGYITSGSDDTTVQVWNATNGSNAFTYSGHTDAVKTIAWSPDGNHIASGSADHTVQVWNATNGSNAFTYSGHSDIVHSVAWSPDGRRVASGSDDTTVQVWEAT